MGEKLRPGNILSLNFGITEVSNVLYVYNIERDKNYVL